MRRYNGKCPMKLLFYLLLALLSHLFSSVSANLNQIFRVQNITFWPPYLHKLREGAVENVRLFLTLEPPPGPPPGPPLNTNNSNSGSIITICYKPDDPTVAWVPDKQKCSSIDLQFTEIDKENEEMGPNGTISGSVKATTAAGPNQKLVYLNTSFAVQGLFLGKTRVTIKVYHDLEKRDYDTAPVSSENRPSADHKNNGHVINDKSKLGEKVEKSLIYKAIFETSIVRDNFRMQHIFVGTLTILLIVANVLMGAQLNLDVVVQVLKKPVAPLIGFSCQYLLMPLVSYFLALMVFVPAGMTTLGLGMFTAGCSPGGGASNGYTLCLDGNVDLSVTMTFVSTVAALVMMPFWMFALGRHFMTTLPGHQIHIPYKNISYSLIVLVLPLIAGVLARKYNQKLAEKANRVLRPFFILIIAFICTFGVYINFYMFRLMTWRVLLAGMCLPWSGFLFGTFASLITKQPLANLKAIAIETGIQNTGISIILLQLSFDQPDADLAAVVPVVVAMFTPPPLVLALIVHYLLKWRAAKKERLKSKELEIENGGLTTGSSTDDENTSNQLFANGSVHQSDSTKPLYPIGEQDYNENKL